MLVGDIEAVVACDGRISGAVSTPSNTCWIAEEAFAFLLLFSRARMDAHMYLVGIYIPYT